MSLKLDPPTNAPNSDLWLERDGILTGNPKRILTLIESWFVIAFTFDGIRSNKVNKYLDGEKSVKILLFSDSSIIPIFCLYYNNFHPCKEQIVGLKKYKTLKFISEQQAISNTEYCEILFLIMGFLRSNIYFLQPIQCSHDIEDRRAK